VGSPGGEGNLFRYDILGEDGKPAGEWEALLSFFSLEFDTLQIAGCPAHRRRVIIPSN
jgi:hypothetical protein